MSTLLWSEEREIIKPYPTNIQVRRKETYAGHCRNSRDEHTSEVHQWAPTRGDTNIDWPEKNIDSSALCRHRVLSTGLDKCDSR